jgi:hypothetical protein
VEVTLPANILYLALLPLPEGADLFKLALKSADELDESDLAQWDQDPPYVIAEDQDTPSEIRWTARLQEVMHGRRLRQQREVDEKRKRYHQGLSQSSLRSDLEGVMCKYRADYDRIERIMSTYEGGSREMVMGIHLLWWKARNVYYTNLQLNSLTDNVA